MRCAGSAPGRRGGSPAGRLRRAPGERPPAAAPPRQAGPRSRKGSCYGFLVRGPGAARSVLARPRREHEVGMSHDSRGTAMEITPRERRFLVSFAEVALGMGENQRASAERAVNRLDEFLSAAPPTVRKRFHLALFISPPLFSKGRFAGKPLAWRRA